MLDRRTVRNAELREHPHLSPLVALPESGEADRVTDDIFGELCATLLRSLRRRDQRERGEQYLRGLLATAGRKSIRNIAAHLDGASEQSLHHFISSSTWDWMPVRAALAAYLERTYPPEVRVVRGLPIPKSGEHSVGMGQGFDPQRQRMFRGQQAFGVWNASPTLSAPINWRLLVSEPWVSKAAGGRPRGIPAEAPRESFDDCALATVLDTVRHWDLPVRPVVLDVRVLAAGAALLRFVDAGLPAIVRISGSSPVLVADRAMHGFGTGGARAQHVLESAGRLRHSTDRSSPGSCGGGHRSLSAAVRVFVHEDWGPARTALTLFGEWHGPRRQPSRMWLTNLAGVSHEELLRMTKLTEQVAHDEGKAGAGAGLRDYEGRSFAGWHRHITLASAAHAVTVAAGTAGCPGEAGIEGALKRAS